MSLSSSDKITGLHEEFGEAYFSRVGDVRPENPGIDTDGNVVFFDVFVT